MLCNAVFVLAGITSVCLPCHVYCRSDSPVGIAAAVAAVVPASAAAASLLFFLVLVVSFLLLLFSDLLFKFLVSVVLSIAVSLSSAWICFPHHLVSLVLVF